VDFLQAGGHRLEYKFLRPDGSSATTAASPTLVFLHEGLGCAARWKSFPDVVAKATGCPALVYSRFGYGKSEQLTESREVDYLHREALTTLPEVLDQLDIRNSILIGHSDGASIAMIHAGSGAQPVRGLVLIAPHVFVEELAVTSIREARNAFETTDLEARLARYHDDPVSTFRGWNDIWLHPDFLRWNIEEYLPGIHCPVLLIQCEDDPYGTLSQIDAIARQVSGPVESCILPEGAHSPHLRQKEKTISAVVRFIGRIRGLPTKHGALRSDRA
jgi:pimeloyl-ACP methyl ester carboxylesterase